jgi:UDPglucose 6-dehydrogenase
MKIAVFGTGYVGLVSGTCFAELGNDVVCVDIDKEKIEMLKKGKSPIYEPGLSEMLTRNQEEKRLIFTTNAEKAIQENDIILICVGTPQKEDGEANLQYIFNVAETVGKHMNGYKVVATKSTVPVGTNYKIKDIISEITNEKFDVASIPEFLKEGTALKDFMNPDRIVIGTESKQAKEMLHELMQPLERIYQPIVHTDIRSAEMIKYTANSFLAMKISFINEIANLCEKVGADISEVYKGIALDKRIGHRFLQSGIGYGGSCFPKDVRALIKTGEFHGSDLFMLEAVDKVNKRQRYVVIEKLRRILGDLEGKTVAVLGLAFKPKTDDIREAPAIDIIHRLKSMGAEIRAFDPIAQENTEKVMNGTIHYAEDMYEALEGADAVVIATQWDEFKSLNRTKMRSLMNQPVIIDGRNILDKELFLKDGFVYEGIGR